MTNITALISGLGSIGIRHAKNLKARGVNEIIGFDPNKERREAFENKLGLRSIDNFEESLKQNPDLVVIASPNSFHVQQATLAASYQCNLLIEKPLGISLDGVNQLIELIEKNNLFAHVGSNWKFHPAFTQMKQLIEAGTIGDVFSSRVHGGYWLPNWHPWEDYRTTYSARKDLGGGIEYDAHELDAISWLLGPAKAISSMSTNTNLLEIDTHDLAVACLRHESGALTTIQMDYLYPVYRRRYEIAGTNGVLEWDFETGLKLFTREKDIIEYPEAKLNDINDMYLLQTEHVLEGITRGTSPITSVTDARQIMNLQIEISKSD